MKTLIIYASTYGYTKECVEKLKELIDGEVIITDIKKDDVPSSDEFDNIIIGGSIYMGQIHKKLKEYCTANLNLLLNKKIALFLCLSLIHISEPTRLGMISYAVFCLKKKKKKN